MRVKILSILTGLTWAIFNEWLVGITSGASCVFIAVGFLDCGNVYSNVLK
jgi:hypothetical protein